MCTYVHPVDRRCDPSRRDASFVGPGECERAARFHFDRDRRRFVVAHAALRKILASYCQIRPAEVEIAHGDYGKPKLTDNWPTISFNLSHSGDLALLVVARDVPVGIDVENHRAGIEFECLARGFIAPSEQAALMAVPPDRRLSAFYRCWTSKEAVLKALGVGLALPLDEFAVAVEPGAPARLLRLRGDPHPAARWNLVRLATRSRLQRRGCGSRAGPTPLSVWRFRSRCCVTADSLRARPGCSRIRVR